MVTRSILVFHVGFIGDTVVSIPALKALRRHYGLSTEICLLHEEHAGIPVSPTDVLSGLGIVDRFLTYRFHKARGRALWGAVRLWTRLLRERFDEVVYLAPSERLAATVRRDARFFRLAGIPSLVGFATPDQLDDWLRRSGQPIDDTRARPEFLRKLDRLAMVGIDVSDERHITPPVIRLPEHAIAEARRWLDSNRRHSDRELVAICPGAKNSANWWPEDRFIEIGRRLLATGRFEVVVVGGASDRAAADRMLAEWQDGSSAAGSLSVLGSAAVLTECRFMLGLDTGMTHLAGALGVGGVAIYGARDPVGLWDPFGGLHTIVRHSVPCAGCRFTSCPLVGHPCMTGIAVENVWNAIVPLIDAVRLRPFVEEAGQQSHS
jgi:heptosyltransferase III